MNNAKAFLEGLIVNEVLTKTASFEKLAQWPGNPLGFNPNQNPDAIPPTLADAVKAFRTQRAEQAAADAAHREAFSQRRQEISDLQKRREELGLNEILQRMPQAQRAIIAKRIREGKIPTDEEVRAWEQKYPGRPKNISPAGPAPKITPPGMGTPGLKTPASPPYPSYPPYPSQPIPPMSGDNIQA